MKDRTNACLLRLFGEAGAGNAPGNVPGNAPGNVPGNVPGDAPGDGKPAANGAADGDPASMNASGEGRAAEGEARSGERSGPASSGTTGSGTSASGSDEAFDALIRGEYRDAFERRVRSILAEREAEKGNAALPEAGSAAGTSDGGGIPSDPRDEPSDLRAEEERRRSAGRRAVLAGWVREAEALRRIAPGFDFAAEMRDPRFRTLVENNVPLEDAFFALRRDAVLPAAMHAAARHAEAAVAAAYLSGQDRPREAAAGGSAVPAPRSDVAATSRADRDEICRRAARGDRIVF